jgi:hypothetical protein
MASIFAKLGVVTRLRYHGHEWGIVSRPATFIYANGRFKGHSNIVAAFFKAGDDLRNQLGLAKALVDSVAKLFHELHQLSVH